MLNGISSWAFPDADAGTSGKDVGDEEVLELTADDDVAELGFEPTAQPPDDVNVKSIVAGSWADRAGLRVGDRLLKVNGHQANGLSEGFFKQVLKSLRPVKLVFERRSKDKSEAGEAALEMVGASPSSSSGGLAAFARTRAHRSSVLNIYRAAFGATKLKDDHQEDGKAPKPLELGPSERQEQQDEQQQQQQRQLVRKWRHLQSSGHGFSQAFAKRRDRCQRLALSGIPDELRWEVWQAALCPSNYVQPRLYQTLLQQETTWIKLIEADAPRTFPGNTIFEKKYLEKMKRVLSAYSAHDPEVGYCQGLNFVVGLLLITGDGAEEDVFWVFVALMQGRSLRHFYKDGFPLLQQYSAAFASLLRQAIPELAQHFDEEGLDVSIFLQPWYLTLFATNLPLPAVSFLWDGIFTVGLPFLLNIGVTMLGNLRNALLEMRFEDMMAFFRTLNQGLEGEDGRRLLQKSNNVQLPNDIRKRLEVVA